MRWILNSGPRKKVLFFFNRIFRPKKAKIAYEMYRAPLYEFNQSLDFAFKHVFLSKETQGDVEK